MVIRFESIALEKCKCCESVYFFFIPIDQREGIDVLAFPIYSRAEGFEILDVLQRKFPGGITPQIYQCLGMAIINSSLPEAELKPDIKILLDREHKDSMTVIQGVADTSSLLIQDAIKV